jgi:hypothetical protein
MPGPNGEGNGLANTQHVENNAMPRRKIVPFSVRVAGVFGAIGFALVIIGLSTSFRTETRITKSGTDRTIRFDVSSPITTWIFLPNGWMSGLANPQDGAASAEHTNIIVSIMTCMKMPTFQHLSKTVKAQFVFPRRFLPPDWLMDDAEDDSAKTPAQAVDGYYRSITELSSLISDLRGELAANLRSSSLMLQWLQIASIITGMITTILVGVKSGASNARRLDVLAIIFAAIGTGVSSITAFYNPKDEYLRNGRAIAQLSQLHTEVSFRLGSGDACLAPSDNQSKQTLSNWYGKLATISSTLESAWTPNQSQSVEKKQTE